MQRFFLDKNFGEILEITDETLYNQITRVLRARIWDEFVFFNTRDNFDYFYKIEIISKNNVILKMFSREEKGSFLQEINLYNALPNKYEKIEYIYNMDYISSIDKKIKKGSKKICQLLKREMHLYEYSK